MKTNKHHAPRKLMSLLLAVVMMLTLVPTAFAMQENTYHDPAESWMKAENRTNELDVNSVVTHETFYCDECGYRTSFLVFRVPEYTKSGVTALSRNVRYSDGTCIDEVSKGYLDDGTPGVNAYYTGNHWCKAVCENCGVINSNSDVYPYGKNIYTLYSCAEEFTHQLDNVVSYECVDNTYHKKTSTSGDYCSFCFGTHKSTTAVLERHDLERKVVAQLANQRFVVTDSCTSCEYSKTSYVGAKSVITNYFGYVDGAPHTLIVSDLSEAGVSVSIRYGNSAESCTLTSAPNYVEAGYYTVYYDITYTCGGVSMVESGVAYVWLMDTGSNKNSCEHGDHNYAFHETVPAGCLTLGYDKYLCTDCGSISKTNYVAALGHLYHSVVIRDATCEMPGKVLEICSRCGDVKVKETAKGEHQYETTKVSPSCVSPGYTLKVCTVCGDRHITNIVSALAHNYQPRVTPASCLSGGHTNHICNGCGSSFITDYTEPHGHVWDKGEKITSPSCKCEGITQYTCIHCGIQKLVAVSAKGHTPGDWIIDKEPTTKAEGSKHTECEDCGAIIETETIPKLEGCCGDDCDCGDNCDCSDKCKENGTCGCSYREEKHPAYIVGYPDGTFGPERNMTRAEASAIFARLLSSKTGAITSRSSGSIFSDVASSAWYSEYVNYLYTCGIVSGDAQKNFRPDDAVTRGEFVTMAVRFYALYSGIEAKAGAGKNFTDVSSSNWAVDYIRSAAANGWIEGYPDGTFRAESNINRAEVVTLVNRLLERTADKGYLSKHMGTLTTFTDLPYGAHWAYFDIIEAANAHTAKVKPTSEIWNSK